MNSGIQVRPCLSEVEFALAKAKFGFAFAPVLKALHSAVVQESPLMLHEEHLFIFTELLVESHIVHCKGCRAPEVILGLSYDQKIDLWSLGCILAELSSGEVLFRNEAIPMLLPRIVGTLGSIDMDMLQREQETNKYFTKEYDLYHINEETDQLEYIIPEETSLENQLQVSDSGFIDFVLYLLETNPKRRLTARQALALMAFPIIRCELLLIFS